LNKLVRSQELGFLFSGFIYCPEFSFEEFLVQVERVWGQILFISPEWDFSSQTRYYEKEMGQNLRRIFAVFDNIISPIHLVESKLQARSWELDLSDGANRRVNIDPGYISPNKIILASTKNHYHRIYLDKGIYLELTLVYYHGDWQRLDWTYPDYYHLYRDWFRQIRGDLLTRLREKTK